MSRKLEDNQICIGCNSSFDNEIAESYGIFNKKLCDCCISNKYIAINLQDIKKQYKLTLEDIQNDVTMISTYNTKKYVYLVNEIKEIAYKIHKKIPDVKKRNRILKNLETKDKINQINKHINDKYVREYDASFGRNKHKPDMKYLTSFTGGFQEEFIEKIFKLRDVYMNHFTVTFDETIEEMRKLHEEYAIKEKTKTVLKGKLVNVINEHFSNFDEIIKICKIDEYSLACFMENMGDLDDIQYKMNKICTKNKWYVNYDDLYSSPYDYISEYYLPSKSEGVKYYSTRKSELLIEILKLSLCFNNFIENIDKNVLTEQDIEKTDIISRFGEVAKDIILLSENNFKKRIKREEEYRQQKIKQDIQDEKDRLQRQAELIEKNMRELKERTERAEKKIKAIKSFDEHCEQYEKLYGVKNKKNKKN